MASRLSEVPFALSSNQQAQYVEERYRLEEVVPRLVHDFKHAVIEVRLKELLRELARPEVMSNPEKYNEEKFRVEFKNDDEQRKDVNTAMAKLEIGLSRGFMKLKEEANNVGI